MMLMSENFAHIQEELEYNFLYNKDPNSMYLLLSMLDNSDKYRNLRPRYRCVSSVMRSLKRTLRNRRDRDAVVQTLRKQVNDDVNRLELCISIHGYMNGYQDSKWTYRIERLALKRFSFLELQNSTQLFQETKNRRALRAKLSLFSELERDEMLLSSIKKITYYYCDRFIRKNILDLNSTVDKQLMFDFNDVSKLCVDEKLFDLGQLSLLYDKFTVYLAKSLFAVFKDAYWHGINDCVLKRYQ